MIYLSGKWMDCLRVNDDIGMLCQPNYPVPPQDDVVWAADTGIFGKNPCSLDRYMDKLGSWSIAVDRCVFATAPDVVGDWEGTLESSLPVIPTIRAMGYPVAIVLQDGATVQTVPWNEIDAVFTGGSTDWKLSEEAYQLVKEAKSRGLWAHMGRVNSYRRLKAAAMSGYDSADGTRVAYSPDVNSAALIGWMDSLAVQPTLEGMWD